MEPKAVIVILTANQTVRIIGPFDSVALAQAYATQHALSPAATYPLEKPIPPDDG